MKHENKLGTPSGFRDLLSSEAGERELLVQAITEVYKRFGFLPLETPVAEFENILVSEGATDFNLFTLEPTQNRITQTEKEEIMLRFDLTVPLARVVSQYGNALPRPFKRYQSGYVFRGERPQKGRYRQFMQFDADVVGTKSLVADAEMIVMISEIMKEIGVSDFVIRVNTRTILNTLPVFAGFPKNLLQEVLVILDKSEKISDEEIIESLRRLRIHEDGIKRIQEFSKIKGEPREVVRKIEGLYKDFQDTIQQGLEELKILLSHLESFSVDEKVIFDMTIIRGFGYYTGPVFETNLLRAPEFGSVISGGRYDGLVERFTNQELPAVGLSVGVDRLQTALQSLGVSLTKNNPTKKLVVFGQNQTKYIIKVASSLRMCGWSVDLYVGNKKDFKDIFSYTESIGVDFLVIVGSQEEANSQISIRNMKTRFQKTISFDEIKNLSIDF